jgi:hypothetical protein
MSLLSSPQVGVRNEGDSSCSLPALCVGLIELLIQVGGDVRNKWRTCCSIHCHVDGMTVVVGALVLVIIVSGHVWFLRR